MNLQVDKEFIIEAHNDACLDWKGKIEAKFPELFPKTELVIGKWYRHKSTDAIICFQGPNKRGFGITNFHDSWTDSYGIENSNLWREATEEEVKEALIAEANKRYGENWETVELKCFLAGDGDNLNAGLFEVLYSEEDNKLWNTNGELFFNGEWAEILPKKHKTTLDVGKWYIASCFRTNGYLILASEITDDNNVKSNCWFSPGKSYVDVTGLFDSVERLAADEEVKTALITEAKKRGFVDGVRYLSPNKEFKRTVVYPLQLTDDGIDLKCANHELLTCNGKWAEILPEEKKVITKEKTLKIIKGERYICRKDVVIRGTEDFFFKRGCIYTSGRDRNLISETGRVHGTPPDFAYKHFLHLPK